MAGVGARAEIAQLSEKVTRLTSELREAERETDRLRYEFHMMDEHEDYDYEQFVDNGEHLRDVIAHLLYATGTYDLTDLKQAAIDAGLNI